MENGLFDFMRSNSPFLFNLIVFFLFLGGYFYLFIPFREGLGLFVEEFSPCLLFYELNIRLYNELILCFLC